MVCRKCYKSTDWLYENKFCSDCMFLHIEKMLDHLQKETYLVGREIEKESNDE